MSSVHKNASLKNNIPDLTDDITGIVSQGGKFYLRVTGNSMCPFLKSERDTAVLSAPENVKVYETVFYKRENGRVVLHRIVAGHGDFYDLCGDHQVIVEKNVPKSAVIAVMREYYKGDKHKSCETGLYKARAFLWVKTRALRHIINKIKIKINRLVKR